MRKFLKYLEISERAVAFITAEIRASPSYYFRAGHLLWLPTIMNAKEKISYASEAKRTPSLTSSEERRNFDNFSLDAADAGIRSHNSNGKQKKVSHSRQLRNMFEKTEGSGHKEHRHLKTSDESSSGSSPNAKQSQIGVCPSHKSAPRSRIYLDDDHHYNMRIPTNVATLKMLLLSAAMAFFSVGAFAIKMKGELMDLKTEYDSLNGIRCMKSPSYDDYFIPSTVNLLSSEMHAFDNGIEDIMKFNHDFEKPHQDLKSFQNIASLISQHLREGAKDAHNAVKFLYSSLETYDRKVNDLTKKLEDVKARAPADAGNMNIQEQRVDESFMLQEKEIQLRSENHQLRWQLHNTTSFLHLAVHVIKGLQRDYKDVMDENDYVYKLVRRNAKEREECTEKFAKLSEEKVELEKHLTNAMSAKDQEMQTVHNQLEIEVQDLEQQLNLMHDKFDEKETQLVSENHGLRWNLYNTTSFLHIAIHIIRSLNIENASVMDENDFVYELIQNAATEREEFHKKIEKLTEDKVELEQKLVVHEKAKEGDNVDMIEAEGDVGSAPASESSTAVSEILLQLEHERHDNDNLRTHLQILRRQLYLSTSTIHLGMWYIRELGEFYEDINEQVDILYEINDEMGVELNRTRECLKVHPNAQWNEVNVEEGKVSVPGPGPAPQNVPVGVTSSPNMREEQKGEE